MAHPVLPVDDAKAFETRLFAGKAEEEWRAMSRAGAALTAAIELDSRELGRWPADAHILVLAGKGHNGGDALLAAAGLLRSHPDARVEVCLAYPETVLRPLTSRALQHLVHTGGERVRFVPLRSIDEGARDLVIDGVFGFQFRPPLEANVAALLERANQLSARMRVAVDLPSGLGEPHAFQADFTYATGLVKEPVLDPATRSKVGRLRYLDLGFFEGAPAPEAGLKVLSRQSLQPLQQWRMPHSDKRDYGHLFVVGGSRSFPGAVLMTVRAALKTGVGLLTGFVPESLVASYAAHVPEAMWVGCPETPEGGLALEGVHLLKERQSRASALAIGPGLTRERECQAFAEDVVRGLGLPAVIDADALLPSVVASTATTRVVTPHAGEFKRLAGEQSLPDYARQSGALTVLKGVPTQISDGQNVYLSLAGGPVLARGGSGDILAGLIGGLLAQTPSEALGAACRGVLWHGLAADALARQSGAVAVNTTELLEHLPAVLRGEDGL